jgi:hypothetical protein
VCDRSVEAIARHLEGEMDVAEPLSRRVRRVLFEEE